MGFGLWIDVTPPKEVELLSRDRSYWSGVLGEIRCLQIALPTNGPRFLEITLLAAFVCEVQREFIECVP